jgi:hypothetical protein
MDKDLDLDSSSKFTLFSLVIKSDRRAANLIVRICMGHLDLLFWLSHL